MCEEKSTRGEREGEKVTQFCECKRLASRIQFAFAKDFVLPVMARHLFLSCHGHKPKRERARGYHTDGRATSAESFSSEESPTHE
jgi:hypothetical protein